MTPLVLVHGFLGGSAQWHDLKSGLEAERPVIALDLPGFGAHADQDPIDSIEGFATWVIEALHAKGINRFHLLGHSMGGMIAQDIIRLDAQSVDRLILYGTGAQGVLPGRFETMAESRRRARKDGPEITARRIAATWLHDREASHRFSDVAQIATSAGIDAIQAGLTAMEHWSGQTNLAKINADTLIIWGDRDRSYKWPQIELLWTEIAATSLCVLPNCAHLAHLEEPELFRNIVHHFISKS